MRAVRELDIPLKKNVRLILGTDEEMRKLRHRALLQRGEGSADDLSPDASFPVINIEKGHFHGQFSASFEKSEAPAPDAFF